MAWYDHLPGMGEQAGKVAMRTISPLTIFDWATPLIGGVHVAADLVAGKRVYNLFLDGADTPAAKNVLTDAGIKVHWHHRNWPFRDMVEIADADRRAALWALSEAGVEVHDS
jgi:hypothetical protein